ncbi:MAG: DNRLRE domain-containing protein, partial [Caldilineaceae bacterium]|nr:DNRLRE domain-containing protein [Caldilineaceae bacterium]
MHPKLMLESDVRSPISFRLLLAIVSALLTTILVGIPLPIQAAPAAPNETIQLTAVGDTFIRASQPDANFEGQQTLTVSRQVVNLGNQQVVFEENALLRFDLSQIPVGSTINRAVLRVAQLDMSGNAAWDISVAQITAEWQPTSTTW